MNKYIYTRLIYTLVICTQTKLFTTRFSYLFACLIKICAYCHVTITPTAVNDYYTEVTLISILILKANNLLILHRSQKGFLLRPVYKHLKGILAYRAPN